MTTNCRLPVSARGCMHGACWVMHHRSHIIGGLITKFVPHRLVPRRSLSLPLNAQACRRDVGQLANEIFDALHPLTGVKKIDESSEEISRSDSLAWISHMPTSGELQEPALLRPKRFAPDELEARIPFSNECMETHRFCRFSTGYSRRRHAAAAQAKPRRSASYLFLPQATRFTITTTRVVGSQRAQIHGLLIPCAGC